MAEKKEEHKYTMTISLNVLNHLGIGLYSNVPAVLSEVVANSYDADATEVDIHIDPTKGEIVIEDDGVGMATTDINEKYLCVGYDKRKNEPSVTPRHKRRPMGRKGIGKLSVFSIADSIEVHSVKDGDVGGLLMSASDIKQQITEGDHQYYPTPLDPNAITINSGTRIILRDLKKNITTAETFLRRRLARRFSIIGPEHNFEVKINGKRITARDREFYSRIEFLWYLGDESQDVVERCENAKKCVKLDNVVDADKDHRVTGWVATAENQESIDEQNNTIVIFARGKLVHEDILKDIKEGGLFTKYLIGEIDADFMDQDDQEDLVTSNRQRVKEDDPRFEAIRDFVQKQILKTIQNQWTDFRKEGATEEALENLAIAEWYERLGGDQKKVAQNLFAKIHALRGIDEEGKKELYKHGILAFEKLALQDILSALDMVETKHDFELLKGLFHSIDEIEAVHYHQIAKGRLDAVRRFEELVDEEPAVKERVLQEYIFDHLWLLHPSWERASTNQRIEETVAKEFDAVTAGLTEEERKGRIDIRYKTAAGRHVIIELKKYDRSVGIYELLQQIDKYIRALRKCLSSHFPGETNKAIETICILGSPPRSLDEDNKNRRLLMELNARYVLYDQLIKESIDSYSEYLERQRQITEIVDIVDRI